MKKQTLEDVDPSQKKYWSEPSDGNYVTIFTKNIIIIAKNKQSNTFKKQASLPSKMYLNSTFHNTHRFKAALQKMHESTE